MFFRAASDQASQAGPIAGCAGTYEKAPAWYNQAGA